MYFPEAPFDIAQLNDTELENFYVITEDNQRNHYEFLLNRNAKDGSNLLLFVNETSQHPHFIDLLVYAPARQKLPIFRLLATNVKTELEADYLELDTLYMAEEYRNIGVGTMVFNYLIKWAEKESKSHILISFKPFYREDISGALAYFLYKYGFSIHEHKGNIQARKDIFIPVIDNGDSAEELPVVYEEKSASEITKPSIYQNYGQLFPSFVYSPIPACIDENYLSFEKELAHFFPGFNYDRYDPSLKLIRACYEYQAINPNYCYIDYSSITFFLIGEPDPTLELLSSVNQIAPLLVYIQFLGTYQSSYLYGIFQQARDIVSSVKERSDNAKSNFFAFKATVPAERTLKKRLMNFLGNVLLVGFLVGIGYFLFTIFFRDNATDKLTEMYEKDRDRYYLRKLQHKAYKDAIENSNDPISTAQWLLPNPELNEPKCKEEPEKEELADTTTMITGYGLGNLPQYLSTYENSFLVVEAEGCEYILTTDGNNTAITHKGNCKFCKRPK